MTRTYLKDAAKELGFSVRTLLKWCIRNNVGILRDIGCKRRYVIKEEFELAKSRQAIKYLKEKYGKDEFPSVVQSFLNIQSEINSVKDEKIKKLSCPNYAPTGKHEVIFMNRLQKIINKV